MAGPRTLPKDVKTQIPEASANADLAASIKSPDLARMAMSGGARTSVAGDLPSAPAELSDEEAQALAQRSTGQAPPEGVSAPSSAAPQPDLTDEEAQVLAQRATGTAPPAAPTGESLTSQATGGLIRGLLGPIWGTLAKVSELKGGEASLGSRVLSAFGKDPAAKAKIFGDQTGLPTRLEGERVQFQRPGEPWKDVSPGYFKSLSSFVGSLAEHSPEALETAISGTTMAVGGLAGGAAGLPSGPGAIGTGLAGAVAGSAAGAALGTLGRESVAKLLGADPDVAIGQEVAMSAAMGAALPIAGKVLRRPLQAATSFVIQKVENSAAGKALHIGELTQSFENLYGQITGRSTPTLGQAGRLAEDAASSAEGQLGQKIGAVWDMAEKRYPGVKFQLPEAQRTLEESLKDAGVRFVEKPRLTPSEPLRFQANFDHVSPEALPLAKRWGSLWMDLSENEGTTSEGLKTLYKEAGREANFGSMNLTPETQAWRELYRGIRTDRGSVLTQAVKGTELEGTAKSVFSEYADKIEALKALSRAAEKSPEKFAQSLFRDAETARVAKSVLSNSNDLASDVTTGWSAVKGAWLQTHYAAAKDAKTGIVDIPKFYASVMKNPDLAEVVLEKDSLATLKSLSSVMSRTTWEGLLQNPDSVQSGAVMKGVAKLILSRGHPGFAVSAVAGMFGHDPKLLKMIQEKGILKYAAEAKTSQERNLWLRSSNMINRVLDATQVKVPLPGEANPTYAIPLENSMIPVLLNAGVRPVKEAAQEQHSAMAQGYQTFLEHSQMRAHEHALAMAQAQRAVIAPGAPEHINPLAYARGIGAGARHGRR